MDKAKKNPNTEDISKILLKKLEKGVSDISISKYSQALETLKKCEIRLEKLINQGVPIDQDLILPTLHNISLCYQSIADFHNCAAYLEACVFNVKRRSELSVSHSSTVAERIRKVRYLCLLYIQLADCFSKLNQHRPALENSRLAIRQCALIIKLCLGAFTEAKQKKQTPNSVTKSKANMDFYTNSIEILQLLYLQMTGKKKKHTKDVTMRSVLGVQRVAEWIYSLTFEKITEIKPLLIQDLKSAHNLRAELSKDFMLDKICLAAAACLVFSRELLSLNEDFSKSKAYLDRAVTISSSFFPSSCPFLQNLLSEYTEKYEKNKEIKKFKSPRSTSAKDTHQNDAGTRKNSEKGEKKVQWKIQSERKPESNTGITKGNHSQSESTIGKNNLKSPPFYEKTEPEPPLSEGSEHDEKIKNFIICSNELYGHYSEEEVDKYEYMPLRRDL